MRRTLADLSWTKVPFSPRRHCAPEGTRDQPWAPGGTRDEHWTPEGQYWELRVEDGDVADAAHHVVVAGDELAPPVQDLDGSFDFDLS